VLTTKFIDIPPLSGVTGTVRVPGSKSISNRALLLAGFAAGTTVIDGVLHSDDTRVMIDALVQLGCGIEAAPHRLTVHGLGNRPALKSATFFLGNAGTAMRPLTATLALFAASSDAVFELRGTPRMHERPIGDLIDALRALGCGVECLEREGFPPLRLSAGSGPLSFVAPLRVRGDVSSQFLSALLMALPLRAEPVDAVIEVEGELISKPYVEITLKLLEAFGIAVDREGTARFRLGAGQQLRSPGRFAVEGDASSASYFIAAAAIGAVDAPLRVDGIDAGSIQGDIAFAEAARAMGARIESGSGCLEVRRGRWPLAPLDLDCNALPDAAMTLAALALFADGPSTLRNIASWRVKETDRLAAMASELRKVGAGVEEGPDFLRITPPKAWRAASIATYDDHRMAMAMSLAAFNPLAGGAVPVRILDPRCVGKTWPDYFEALFSVAKAPREAVPVLTIDGPTASGKGTLAREVANALGYRLLDSGAVYRAVAIAALDAAVAPEDEPRLALLAAEQKLRFDGDRCHLGGRDVTDLLRREEVGAMASKISAWPAVRAAVLEVQLGFRDVPGLVADGRDMGSVVFPDAELKVFLTAGAAERAERRYKQLISKGIPAKLDSLRAELEARDARDKNRSASPLVPAEGAFMLDNSALSIEASVDAVLEAWQERRPFDRTPV
jgi:3-phosphoshikimate 1-carboxyvinyltransferase